MSKVWTLDAVAKSTHTLAPTCFPPPGLSFSFVRSLTTVVPRLYSEFASPTSSTSKSPCMPSGAGDSDARGESGAREGFVTEKLSRAIYVLEVDQTVTNTKWISCSR